MKISSSELMRWAGLSTVVAGLGFIIVGLFHPVNVPSSVITDTWINVHIVAIVMCFFGLFGMTGLYIRQIEKFGWLGLVGFIFLCVWMGAVMCFSAIEAFVLPHIANQLPVFVEGFLGMFSGLPSQINLGIMPTLWIISGPMYILGQLLFGIATYLAGVLPRNAGALLAVSGVLTPMGALVPPEYQPLVMVPIGLSLMWMGYSLWSEQKN